MKEQQNKFREFQHLAKEQYEKEIEFQHIEINLKEAGASEEMISIILEQIKTLHFLKRKKRGFKLVIAGAFLLVFGFILTLLLFNSGNSINYAMYGLTLAGIALLLWGMIEIMGW